MKSWIANNPRIAHDLLRYTLAVVFLSHTITRIVTNRVGPFGKFLDSSGFPYGIYWAWGVTLWELVGGVLLMLGLKTRIVSLIFIVQMIFATWLVHWKHGWFVVGHGSNGIEYPLLLISVLLATALTASHTSR